MLSAFVLVFVIFPAYNFTVLRAFISAKGGFFNETQLVFAPSALLHGAVSHTLSFRIQFPEHPDPYAAHPRALPAGRSNSLLQICGHPLFCMVSVDPVHPVLPSVEGTPGGLLAAVYAAVQRYDHCAGLLRDPAHRAESAPLLCAGHRHLRPCGAVPVQHRHTHQCLPVHPCVQLGHADACLSPLPHL